MKEVLKKLENVQELDSQIGNILKKKAEFPIRLEGFQNEIQQFNAKIQVLQTQIDEIDKNKKQQTGALELNEDRAKRSQEKLESIKTNQEYQALQKEIEGLKKSSEVLKENANKLNAEIEKLETEKKSLTDLRATVQEKLDTESSKISSEEQGFDGELKRLQSLRTDAIVGIDKRYLATYDKVRIGRGGIGIVPAANGNCKGCNMRIPPQMYIELQRSQELHLCPSCKRILMYKDSV